MTQRTSFRPSFPPDPWSHQCAGSGTGAWEAALVNTLSPGDLVLMAETGHFATLWQKMATELGLRVEFLPGDWRRGADPQAIEARLRSDAAHEIRAASEHAALRRSYWDWREMIASNATGYFPYTPATNLLSDNRLINKE